MQQEPEKTWMKVSKKTLVKAILYSDQKVKEEIAKNLRTIT